MAFSNDVHRVWIVANIHYQVGLGNLERQSRRPEARASGEVNADWIYGNEHTQWKNCCALPWRPPQSMYCRRATCKSGAWQKSPNPTHDFSNACTVGSWAMVLVTGISVLQSPTALLSPLRLIAINYCFPDREHSYPNNRLVINQSQNISSTLPLLDQIYLYLITYPDYGVSTRNIRGVLIACVSSWHWTPQNRTSIQGSNLQWRICDHECRIKNPLILLRTHHSSSSQVGP